VIVVVSNGANVHSRSSELRDDQRVDPVILGMRANKIDEGDLPVKIESHDHPKAATCDFKSRPRAVQNLRIRRCETDFVD
jgi:hypothetical protein